MTDTADVIVIGGGVVGLSVAYHLAERGVGRVVLLEADRCGGGATLRATGGVRHQFGTTVNVAMSLLARPFWQSFDTAFGTRGVFRALGYLFLATTPALVAVAERNVALQTALGVPARLVTPDEAATLTPGLNTDGVLIGTYCPWDGMLAVDQVVSGLVAGCRRAGIDVREATPVVGIAVAGARVVGVTTPAGAMAAPVVINAAGNAAAAIGALVGVALPVRPERRQAALTVPTPAIDSGAAWTIDLGSGVYARPDVTGGTIIGGGDRGATSDVPADQLDATDLARLRDLAGRRFPGLAGVALARAWVGQRPMSPDDHAILGPTSVDGFMVACGLGSHGLMHAPAVGRLLAELIVDGAATSLDIALLGPARFATGALLSESVRF
ncbi:MAG: FAD-binding oxidoreductase [Chloroflexi bacterium]|nr:FAD-binding oxidoreductase [Chloroflexota bacterium]